MKNAISVFRTNFQKQDAKKVGEYFKNQNNIVEWSVDYEDVDRVLRIVSSEPIEEKDLQVNLAYCGFQCSAL